MPVWAAPVVPHPERGVGAPAQLVIMRIWSAAPSLVIMRRWSTDRA